MKCASQQTASSKQLNVYVRSYLLAVSSELRLNRPLQLSPRKCFRFAASKRVPVSLTCCLDLLAGSVLIYWQYLPKSVDNHPSPVTLFSESWIYYPQVRLSTSTVLSSSERIPAWRRIRTCGTSQTFGTVSSVVTALAQRIRIASRHRGAWMWRTSQQTARA